MSDRNRRTRRPVNEITAESSSDAESDSGDDWDDPQPGTKRKATKPDPSSRSPTISRAKRNTPSVSVTSTGSSATVHKTTSSDDHRQSIRLTVKVPPSRLREVMRANEVDALQDVLGGGKVIDGPRSRRSAPQTSRASGRKSEKPKYAEYAESDIEDDEEDGENAVQDGDPSLDDIVEAEGGTDDEEDGEEDENEEEEEEQEEDEDNDDDGAEEADDDDEDAEMEDAEPVVSLPRKPLPKPPRITLKAPSNKADTTAAPKLILSPPNLSRVKPVEDQEMEDDPDDEEVDGSSALSDNDDNEEGDEDDGDEVDEEDDEDDGEEADAEAEGDAVQATPANGQLAAGEDEDEELEEDDDDDGEDEEDEDSDETPHSGMATPDPTKQTKRQRGRPEDQGQLMALDMAPQQRKFFTDAEKLMKKDEHARKRKELTKRKVQEEKAAALNRLLKPQANKSRGAAPKPETLAAATAAASATAAAAAAAGSPAVFEEYGDDGGEQFEKPNPLYTRWVSNADGVRLGVPEEWMGKRIGEIFARGNGERGEVMPKAMVTGGGRKPGWSGRMVEEID